MITELAVFEFRDKEIYLTDIAEGVDIEELRIKTACHFCINDSLKVFWHYYNSVFK